MNVPYKPLTPYSIIWATSFGSELAQAQCEAVERLLEDVELGDRTAAQECAPCWYLRKSRIGGAAMTSWYCGVCATSGVAGSTAVPRVCRDCAKQHHLCTNCGGDFSSRRKRRKFPTPVAPEAP